MREETKVRAHVIIRGRVQGVFYRASCRNEGGRLDLQGWVKNLPDGGVEAVAEGPRDRVDRWLMWCRRGPGMARVEEVNVDWEAPQGEMGGFRVEW